MRSLAGSLSTQLGSEILAKVKGELPRTDDLGPTKTLLTNEAFNEIRLLSTYPEKWNRAYVNWLGRKAEVVCAELKAPTDYAAILRIADAELSKLKQRKTWESTQLCLHLSPGTPAMAAIWLLLGKTSYPAIFYETFNGKSWRTDVPFDLTIDVLPELLRSSSTTFQHLIAESPRQVEGFQDIVGDSQEIRKAVGMARRASMQDVPVLLLGESGTGKELFAQAIHHCSSRRDKPFLAINCAALSKTLLESELFGHVKGAFTGADRLRKGAFEEANGGCVFLDEIGEMDLETQAKLLRVLQPIASEGPCLRKIRRLGDEKDIKVDVRVLAATNRDLLTAINRESFRSDLYHRIGTVCITLPPLRKRKADIISIAERLLARINQQFETHRTGYTHKKLSASTNSFMRRHEWPGNVRQLNNALTRAAVMTDGPTIERDDIEAALGEFAGKDGTTSLWDQDIGEDFDLEEQLKRIRIHYLRQAMTRSQGVLADAAKLLGLKNYQTLANQLKSHGLADLKSPTKK
jgi:transcriptional regulator with GAF, ATPase, and Fis domain